MCYCGSGGCVTFILFTIRCIGFVEMDSIDGPVLYGDGFNYCTFRLVRV